ncbi:cytidylyltransferase domain-containing protein [uncultured Helicobacter sp.]|uniref:acylneuraminate cytidylyltransferase family protein n=1 Tax=uncultured Helicobacter sp. TaxID=175537 RepID=UPI003751B075
MEVTAIVVVRKGSVRIKSKSLLKLNGQTLIERKICQLRATKKIHRVVFGSDCEQMRAVAKNAGAEVVERDSYFCDESRVSANEMIGEMMSLVHTDIVVWAHCTNPLISSHTYDNAVSTFLTYYGQYDSLCSVVELKEHLWCSDKHTPLYMSRHTPARSLPPLYMQDGGIFIQPYMQMKANSYFFGRKPYLFEIPKEEFLDINEIRDYLLAKSIIETSANSLDLESSCSDNHLIPTIPRGGGGNLVVNLECVLDSEKSSLYISLYANYAKLLCIHHSTNMMIAS